MVPAGKPATFTVRVALAANDVCRSTYPYDGVELIGIWRAPNVVVMAPTAAPSGKLLRLLKPWPFSVPPIAPLKYATIMMSDADPLPIICTPKLGPVIRPLVVPTEELVGPWPRM